MENIRISLSDNGLHQTSEIRVDGVIDTITAGELEEVIESLLKRGRYRIVVDLAGVDYISSAGWGIFISHIRDLRSRDGDIVLANMIANVYEIYQLLEFDNVIKAFASLDLARSEFGPPALIDPSKKKAVVETTLKVVDSFITTEPSGYHNYSHSDEAETDSSDLETRILHQVKIDPFASILQIRGELGSGANPVRTGWWKVFRILQTRRLLTRRSRFRYARGRY